MRTAFLLALAFLFLDTVRAGIYVVEPLKGSTCRANKPCTITWLENGERPLLSAVGVSTVGLFTGRQQLVQTIPPVDVSKTQSVTFTPNPSAGPDSDTYYIAITSTALKGNDSIPYSAWSPFFKLTGMSGSFETPLSSATAPIAIPSSLTLSTSGSIATSTRVILPPSSTTTSILSKTTPRSSSSRLSTVFISSTSISSTSSSTSTPTTSSTSKFTTTVPSTTPTSASTLSTTPLSAPVAPVSASTSAAAVADANTVATSSAGSASRFSLSVSLLMVASSVLFLTLS
ncbi:hypothetical protein BDN70DRAFT_841720 [Pholiota conissans]|uniref:Yeast cell wall synthesis Kre9/Knh1-like N-terminal domain-containing protein n=1 Tax=Pholiota conissans TaxID=109636 RepID=A0A9P6CW43_9AGAR|nr:hypothetical protein BDN70DRAFT_841720 [Pholiota conissans]